MLGKRGGEETQNLPGWSSDARAVESKTRQKVLTVTTVRAYSISSRHKAKREERADRAPPHTP
jgi:hypothetical protein